MAIFLVTLYTMTLHLWMIGEKWVKMYDNVRMKLSNDDDRMTQRSSFVNNTNTSMIDGEQVQERQWLSKSLRPRPDNK